MKRVFNSIVKRLSKPATWLLGAGLFLSLIYVVIAIAQPSSASALGNYFSNIIPTNFIARVTMEGVAGLLAVIASLVYSLATFIIVQGATIVSDMLSDQGSIVGHWWGIMRSFANAGFIIALVALSIMVMLRQGGYNIKKAITSLIVAAILVNLSWEIAKAIIDVGHYLYNIIQSTTSMSWTGFFEALMSDLGSNNTSILETLSAKSHTEYMVAAGMSALVSLVYMFVAIKLGFVFLERLVRLIIYTIFAPVAFAIGVFPQKEIQGLSSKWWSEMIKWSLVLPVAALIINIAIEMQATYVTPDTSPLYCGLIDMVGSGGFCGAGTTERLWGILVVSVLLIASAVPTLVGLGLSATTKMLSGSFENQVKSIGTQAYDSTKVGAKGMAKNAAFQAVQKNKTTAGIYDYFANAIASGQATREDQAKGRKLHATKLARSTAQKNYQINFGENSAYGQLKDRLKRENPDISDEALDDKIKEADNALWNAHNVAKKTAFTAVGQNIKDEKDATNPSPEHVEAELQRLFRIVAQHEAKKEAIPQSVLDKLQLMGGIAITEANKTGPGAVPWRELINPYIENAEQRKILKDQAFIPWMPKTTYDVSKRDRDKFIELKESRLTPEQLVEHAKGQSELNQLEDELEEIRQAIVSNPDPNISAFADYLSSHSVGEVSQLLDAIKPGSGQAIQLSNMPYRVLDQDMGNLNENEKIQLRGIRNSNDPQSTKAARIEAVISRTVPNSNHSRLIAELMSRGMSVEQIRTAKGLAGKALSDQSLSQTIAQLLAKGQRADRLRSQYGRLDLNINKAYPGTSGYNTNIRAGLSSGRITTQSRQKWANLEREVIKAFANQNPTKDTVTNPVNYLSDDIKNKLAKVASDLDIATSLKPGKNIGNGAEFGENMNYQDTLSMLRNAIGALDNINNPQTPQPSNNDEDEES